MRTHSWRRLGVAMIISATGLTALAACSDNDGGQAGTSTSIKLITHDSFVVTASVLQAFEQSTGITVEQIPAGDAGAMVNQLILTKDRPLADVMFGLDNTFLSRALDQELFIPYEASELSELDPALVLDREHRVTPIDIGDVCINVDRRWFEEHALAPPTTLDDLALPRYRDLLVVEDPATSSPGLAFVAATVAQFGDGYVEYWQRLKDNGVRAVSGWEEAYNGEFTGGEGEQADRPMVVSYASSPAAAAFLKPPPAQAPTAIVDASCFRQVEFAGILRGTKQERAAQQLIDFLLSLPYQNDIPFQQFVFPINRKAQLPPDFARYASLVAKPLALPPARIAEERDTWIAEWQRIIRG